MTTVISVLRAMPWTPFEKIWGMVISRLRMLKQDGDLTYEQLGNVLGVNKSTVKRWLDGDRGGEKTPAPDLFRYMDALGVLPGEVFSDPLPSSGEYAFIRRATARPAAGGGSLETSGETEGGLVFKLSWLKTRTTSSPDRLRIMPVKGASMSPTFEDGDVVLVDEGNTTLTPDRVYVIRKGDEIYVKRFRKTPDAMLFMGDNRERSYEDVRVLPDEDDGFSVIGRVLWAGKEM